MLARSVCADATTNIVVPQKSALGVSASAVYRVSRTSNISRMRCCHCSTSDAGASTRRRRTRPLETSGVKISPASIVLPRPTSSATSQRVGHASRTRRQTHNWCGSRSTREFENTPQLSFTERMATARIRESTRAGGAGTAAVEVPTSATARSSARRQSWIPLSKRTMTVSP